MSTTTDKVKELGVTKGEAKLIGALVVVTGATGCKTVADCDDHRPHHIGEEEISNARLYCDAHNTAQKSGCLPSELLEQRDEAVELLKKALLVLEKAGYNPAYGTFISKGPDVETLNRCRSFLARIKQGRP